MVNLSFHNEKYNLAKILIYSNNFKIFDPKNIVLSSSRIFTLPFQLILLTSNFTYSTNNILNKICIFCIKSKYIQVIKQNKSIISMINKLKKVYIKLLGPYNLEFQS